MRFMAMASVSCASLEIEPNDMAPVAKRFTISAAGSTSSSGTGSSDFLHLQQPAQRAELPVLLVDQVRVFLESLEVLLPHRVLQLGDGLRIDQVILAARAVLIVAADRQLGLRFRRAAGRRAGA